MSKAVRKTVVSGGCKEVERRNVVWTEQARQDAMKAFARDLPNPEDAAFYLHFAEANALRRATRVNVRNGFVLHATQADARLLRPLGLCEVGGREITTFGRRVRDCLMEQEP